MGINDSNKTDSFDNELSQLVHNDIPYQGSTETTLVDIKNTTAANNTTLPSRSILIGGNDGTNIRPVDISNTTPKNNQVGIVVRPIPYEPPTFVAVGTSIAYGNLKHMISIMNASGSLHVVKLKNIKIINNQTLAIAGVAVDLRALRITGTTGGTSITPLAYDTNDTLPTQVTCTSGSTVTGEGTTPLFRRVYSSDEWGPGAQDVESNDHINQSLTPTWSEGYNQKPITLRAGQGLTIKCLTNTTVSTLDFEIIFTVELL